MNLLSLQSCKRIDAYFKFVGQFANYKQISYLSFYINQKGDKIKYDPNLSLAPTYRDPKNDSKYTLEQYMDTVNQTYLYSQSLLTGLFHNQIVSLQQSQKLLKNCVDLSLLSKKDITNFMFGSRFSYDIRDWVQHFKKGEFNTFNLKFESKEGKLPDQKRKNYFIVVDQKITNFHQLEELVIHKNQFLEIPNINKILCLDMQVQNINKFNDELFRKESFFKQKNVKIKNLSSDKIPKNFQQKHLNLGFRIQKLIQYIAKNIKGNTLIHQLPEYYQFYSEAQKSQNIGIETIQRLQPKQTFVFTQRMRQLNHIGDKSQFSFQQLTKSFTNRFDKDPYFNQFSKGLLISRYLSIQSKQKNEKIIKMQENGEIHVSDD